MNHSTYAALLKNRGFQSYLWTQFLGSFNDNVFKMIVSVAAVTYAGSEQGGSQYLALAGVVFVLPFLLFAGYAGQLADRFSKTQVMILTKPMEIPTMIFGLFALQAAHMPMLLAILFLLAAQANFFSPAKYGLLPEVLPERDLSRANALVELTTFISIVIGGGAGTMLFEHWKQEPWKMGAVMIALALVGSAFSLGIPRVPASGSREKFHLNPFTEIFKGFRIIAADRPMALTVAGLSFFWYIGALVQLTLIVFVNETLHGSETQIGMLVAAIAIGIGAGSILAGRLSGDRIELGLVAPSGLLMGVAVMGASTASTLSSAFAWLLAAGIGAGLFAVPLNAFLQDEAKPEEKGRVLGTNGFANALGAIAASGTLWLLHDILHWSGSAVFLAAGIFTFAVSLYIFQSHMLSKTIRFGFWTLLHLVFRVETIGARHLPRKGGAVIVSNHVSYADAVLIGAATPRFVRFLLWKVVHDNPAFQPLFRLMKTIPINLGSRREAVAALLHARKEVETGEIVGIFPEGQLTRTGHLLPFKRGYEKIAESRESGTAPVIPVWLHGLWGHPLTMKGGRLFASWERWFRRRVTVVIGEPIHESISPEDLHARVLELGTQAAIDSREPSDTLGRRFVLAAREQWDNRAMADSFGKDLTFGRALTAAQLLRRWLDRHARGQKMIGLLLPNSTGAALANIAVTLGGRTAVNLNFTTGNASMQSAISQCGIRTVLTSKLFLAKAKLEPMEGAVYLEDLLTSFSGTEKAVAYLQARSLPLDLLAKGTTDDVAAVIFSSGSTGEPKGVELTHFNLLSNMDAVGQVYPVNTSDCMLGILPFFHSFGFTYNLWFPLLHKFPVILHPNPSDAKTIGELSQKYGATFLLSTPTFASTYARKCTREQFSKIQYVLVGAEKLRPAIARQFEEKFGLKMHEGYGCTEMAPVVAVNGPDLLSDDPQMPGQPGNRAESVGRPLPGISIRIVDPATFKPLPRGSEGLLLVAGPSRMRGYLGQPERTASVLVDGYYNTGDMARMDEEGFLSITGRLSRFSKIGGEMVPHLKIEETVLELLGEANCFVTGIPDEQRGERLVILHTAATVTAASVIEHLSNTGLPALWIPKRDQIFAVESLPSLGTGKLDLKKAKEMAVQLGAVSRQAAVAE